MVDLGFAIGLPPEEAVSYLKNKGYTFSFDWQDTWQEAHAKAFTVAKAMKLDILQDIKEVVNKAVADGITLQDFRKELEPRLKAKGWWGKQTVTTPEGEQQVQLGSPYRLKTIYHTNVMTAYSAGRYKQDIDNANNAPYWQYRAVMDKVTRPAHAQLNGKIFRFDDPFWDTFYPPNGWGCRCTVVSLSASYIKTNGLNVSSSDDKVKMVNQQVSEKTGEVRPVAVYEDKKNKIRVATDPGWSYNPGKAAWYPELDKYDYDVASKWVEGALTSPSFEDFYRRTPKGNFPVYVLNPKEMEALGAKKQTVYLSGDTLKEHKTRHPEITIEDYQKIPEILKNGEIYKQNKDRLIYLTLKDIVYRAVLKTTMNKSENYFLTLFKTTNDLADKQVRNKYKKI